LVSVQNSSRPFILLHQFGRYESFLALFAVGVALFLLSLLKKHWASHL